MSEDREKVPYAAGMSCRALQLDLDDDILLIILEHACKGTSMFIMNSVCKGWKSSFDRQKTEFDRTIVARIRERFPVAGNILLDNPLFQNPRYLYKALVRNKFFVLHTKSPKYANRNDSMEYFPARHQTIVKGRVP